jgi:UPF0042 nucleotide-binding protein
MKPQRLIVVTGLSGSGKSTAARALEDDGFFVVDNLPVVLLPGLLEILRQDPVSGARVAVVFDTRNRDFLAASDEVLNNVVAAGCQLEVLFFDASDDVIQRRFSETRRRHPVSTDGGVAEGIRLERLALSDLHRRSTAVLDTSRLTPQQLRARVLELVRADTSGGQFLLCLQSFGFRYGVPPDSDLVMDVRFLPNPHYVKELQPLTGLSDAVSRYVIEHPVGSDFLKRFHSLLAFLLPHYRQEGKSYLTISIGCTGGRHRSVAVVEALAKALADSEARVRVVHRDVDKGNE